jgi:serine/threonine protein phosphatase 1
MKKNEPLSCLALSPNVKGQDYFVGDIHGQFTKLKKGLQAIGFRPERDRLIAVGDLIDRGNESVLAHEWLAQPFFHSVRGNHEDLYLHWRALRHSTERQSFFEQSVYFKIRNGGNWVAGASAREHHDLEQAFEKLPYFMAVGHPSGKTVGVVHAELPDGASWPELLQTEANTDYIEGVTWGRGRITTAFERLQGRPTPLPEDGNHIPGLNALVVGHAVVPQVQVLGGIVYADIGAWHHRNNQQFAILRMDDVINAVEKVRTGAKPARLQPLPISW